MDAVKIAAARMGMVPSRKGGNVLSAPKERTDRPGTWYYSYKDHRGRWRKKSGFASDGAAWADKIVTESALQNVKLGLETPEQYEQARDMAIPLIDLAGRKHNLEIDQGKRRGDRKDDDLLIQFRDHMTGEGRSRMHVRWFTRYAEDMITTCRFKSLGDIEPNEVDKQLARRIQNGASFATRNRYLSAIKAFVNWAVERRMLQANPLKCLHKLNERKDPRRPNRALTEDQFESLIATAPARYRVFYMVSALTGGRWSEIARLEWQHVDFDRREIYYAPNITKTGEPGTVSMNRELTRALREFRPVGASLGDKIFGNQPQLLTWKKHLKTAGIPHQDGAGRIADRKCLRSSFASWLIAKGVLPRELQILMRHADISTTMRYYSDPTLVDTASAVQLLGKKVKKKKGVA